MRTFMLLCFMSAIGCAYAQLGPEHRFVYPAIGSALCIHDMNGDGDGDVVRQAGGHLWLMEQTAVGDFRTTADLGLVGTVDRIRLGDLDGDGIDDLVFNDRTNGSIDWVPVLGGGSFGALAQLATGLTSVFDVRLADVDGDLDLDLFHVNGAGTSTVAWSQNLGGGVFGAGGSIFSGSLGTAPLDLVNAFDIADIDMDGDVDVAMLQPSLRWYANNGGGVFAMTALSGGTSCSDIILTDVDGDLDADLLLSYVDATGGDLLRALNNGSGVFSAFSLALPFPADDTYLRGLTAVDLEGDGDQDIVVQTNGDIALPDQLLYLVNNGSGAYTFGAEQIRSDNYKPWAGGDWDGDVLLDLVSYSNDGLIVKAGAGSELRINSIVPTSITPFDLGNDGDLDAAVCRYAPFSPIAEGPRPWGLALHTNPGSGDLLQVPKAANPDVLSVLRTVPGDLDGDGDMDLVAVWGEPLVGTTKQLFILHATGSSLDSTATVGGTFWSMFFGVPIVPLLRDLDMDGDTDIFRYIYSDIQINLNTGLGSFGPDQDYYLGTDYIPSGVALADMDGDSDPDYIWSHGNLGGSGIDSIFWRQNTGGGIPGANFFAGLSPVQTHNDIAAQNSPILRTMDLDNDGLEDLVVFAGDSIGVLRNSGSGSFLTGQALPANDTYALDIGDMDLDGLPDLIALRLNGDLLFWYNLGAVTFGVGTLIATAADHTGTDDVRLADMNGDGILDVVTCSANGSAAWLGNNGFPLGITAPAPIATSGIEVFPNPTSDGLRLRTAFILDAHTQVVLSDARGAVLRTFTGNGAKELGLDVSGIAAGLYTARVLREGAVLGVVRVVVQ